MNQLLNRSIIRITGQDAFKFLQNITTNDINNPYTYNYLLSPQGKYLYDFFIYKISNENLLIDADPKNIKALMAKLNIYKLRSVVEIQDISEFYSIIYSDEKQGYQDPRFNKLGYRLIVKTSDIDELELVSDNLYYKDKYEYAIPDGSTDLIFDRSIPLHYGAEELNGISYSKGCYIGQEVISRTKYQGVVRKKIYKLQSSVKMPLYEIGSDITNLAGDKIGVFCSCYDNLAIALLDEEKYVTFIKNIVIINNKTEAFVSLPEWRIVQNNSNNS